MRTKAVDVPDQEGITKDNISVRVNAVIYYKVISAEKSLLEVEDFFYAVSQLAQTTMRNVVGQVDLDELLSNREQISTKIRTIVDEITDKWGIEVESVELKDITLPDNMKRVIGMQAEAEREKRAVIIKSEGEVGASENLAKAAAVFSRNKWSITFKNITNIKRSKF